jgi:hypothetical protein
MCAVAAGAGAGAGAGAAAGGAAAAGAGAAAAAGAAASFRSGIMRGHVSETHLSTLLPVGTHVDGATNNPNNRGRRRDRGHRRVRERKRSFLSHLYHINAIFLPRQAQDKHRESTQKRDDAFSSQVGHATSARECGAKNGTFCAIYI